MTKVIVSTQYQENYGLSEGKEYWKNKGGFDFVFEIDFEILMYSNTTLKEVVEEIIATDHNNKAQRFNVVAIDMATDQIQLDGKVIADRVKAKLDAKADALESSLNDDESDGDEEDRRNEDEYFGDEDDWGPEDIEPNDFENDYSYSQQVAADRMDYANQSSCPIQRAERRMGA